MFDLKGLRKDHKLTQQQIADWFGCLPSNISMIEKHGKLTESQKSILQEKFGKDILDKYKFIDKSMTPSNQHAHTISLDQALKDKERIIELQAQRIAYLEAELKKLNVNI